MITLGGGSGSDVPVLEVSGLSAGYGDLAAVRDVSLELRQGEVVALFGPNGAGKTSTLLATVGVLSPFGGEILWRGKPTRAPLHKLARSGLAFVPEERSIIRGLSVRDNLRLGSGPVDAALEIFPELSPLLRRQAGLLSGGEQQMLTLGRALAGQPAALLVDELSLGLAPLVVERLMRALRQAADERGVAVLLVEQQARRALALADRWYLLNRGCIVQAGRGAEGFEAAYLASMTESGAANSRGSAGAEGPGENEGNVTRSGGKGSRMPTGSGMADRIAGATRA
jgi:branched-chain amino acid transport system ATP-binding protein